MSELGHMFHSDLHKLPESYEWNRALGFLSPNPGQLDRQHVPFHFSQQNCLGNAGLVYSTALVRYENHP